MTDQSGAAARLAAALLLEQATDNKRTLDEALAQTREYTALTGPDRGFARAMASAALRELGRIDIALAPFLSRPLDTATPLSRAFLRIGAAQMWVMGTPPHAAVAATVDAVKAHPRTKKAAGFTNAVLRKVSTAQAAFDAVPATAVWPDWLTVAMMQSCGIEGATALAEAQTVEPSLQITPKDPAGAAAIAEALGGTLLACGSIDAPTGNVEEMAGYDSGDWWVQDAAAALPARVLNAQPNERVIDMCAAPGGKTLQIAAAGAQTVAVDRSAKRLERLSENLERCGLSDAVQVIAANGEKWHPGGLAEKVLLDAPCSALGTLRRHPEGAWIKTAEEIGRFPGFQGRLLAAAADMVEIGGTIIYCVCTPIEAEGAGVIEWALGAGKLKRNPITPADAPGFEDSITPKGDLLTLPGNGFAHDAFFICRLTRIA